METGVDFNQIIFVCVFFSLRNFSSYLVFFLFELLQSLPFCFICVICELLGKLSVFDAMKKNFWPRETKAVL